ncbi:MAG: PepSY-associated TM helix domain-containing protein [Gemmatimonadota bacterium]
MSESSDHSVLPPFGGSASPVPRQRPIRLRVHATLRWLHVYISMVSLLVIFFFAVTGITLNHPDWVFGKAETVLEETGTLPAGWEGNGDADVDWLLISEHLRAEHGVGGNLFDYRVDDFEGSLAFKSPGYAADAFFDPETGDYDLIIVSQGPVGVLNQLHRGTEAEGPWRLIIDISGVLLALLSITGFGLLLYLRKFRVSALITMVVGGVIAVVIMVMAT